MQVVKVAEYKRRMKTKKDHSYDKLHICANPKTGHSGDSTRRQQKSSEPNLWEKVLSKRTDHITNVYTIFKRSNQ